MKATLLLSSALLALITITSLDAKAQGRPYQKGNIATHHANQHQRIKQGVKSGELTHKEAAHLRSEQKEVRQDVRMAKSDGKVTAVERKMIRTDQHQNSRQIYRQKHDKQSRN